VEFNKQFSSCPGALTCWIESRDEVRAEFVGGSADSRIRPTKPAIKGAGTVGSCSCAWSSGACLPRGPKGKGSG